MIHTIALRTSCLLATLGAALPLVAAEPLRSGIDKGNISQTIKPGQDFFEYVNDGWLKSTPIPADKSNYGAFTILDDNTQDAVRKIIEEAATDKQAPAGSERQKVGDFYRTYMDVEARNKAGIDPVRGMLDAVAAIKDKHEILPIAAMLYRQGVGSVLSVNVEPDAKKSEQYAVYVGQSGISLPDRDYYLKSDGRNQAMQAALRDYAGDMLTAAGVKDTEKNAADIYELEAKLAELQWTNVQNRDPEATYNKKNHTDLASELPNLNWPKFVSGLGFEKESSAIIQQVSFIKGVAELVESVPVDTWKNYFTYQVMDAYAPVLTEQLERRHFEFHEKTISGVAEQKVLWRRGVEATNHVLGEVVGKLYVEKYFAPEAKARMLQLVENLKQAAAERIDKLEWMGPATKAQARKKLAKFTTKIGYPDKWKDYSKLTIAGDSIAKNMMRSSAFEIDRQMSRLGGPIDRTEWLMTPQTINAYYNPVMNEIVFPAAILQPPFFDMSADDAVNYGGIGAVIGHELSHGFDDQGSQYDGDGNLRKWWTTEDRDEFEGRSKELVAQYNSYKPFEDMNVNGELTLGENIGDLGGLNFAYTAYKNSLEGKPAEKIDGLTGDQRFFLGWGQVWRRLYREPELRRRLLDDPHSPSRYRVNGIVSNMDAFYEAFEIKPGDAMYIAPENRVRIW